MRTRQNLSLRNKEMRIDRSGHREISAKKCVIKADAF